MNCRAIWVASGTLLESLTRIAAADVELSRRPSLRSFARTSQYCQTSSYTVKQMFTSEQRTLA